MGIRSCCGGGWVIKAANKHLMLLRPHVNILDRLGMGKSEICRSIIRIPVVEPRLAEQRHTLEDYIH